MARDLVAKRAVERYVRRKARGPRRSPFSYLACCNEHEFLQDRLGQAELQLNRQSSEVKDCQRARAEEVLQLGAEVLHLRQQLQSRTAANCGCGSDCASPTKANGQSQEERIQLETELIRSAVDLEQLHKQLLEQRLRIEQTRQQHFQALREAANCHARLAVVRELNTQEMSQLRQRCFSSSSPPLNDWVSGATDEALNPEEANQLEEVEATLARERVVQQLERTLLEEEIRAMHEKADKELSESTRIDNRLARQCASLHNRASYILHRRSSKRSLPPLPLSASWPAGAGMAQDLGVHSQWLQALTAEFDELLR